MISLVKYMRRLDRHAQPQAKLERNSWHPLRMEMFSLHDNILWGEDARHNRV